MTPPLQQDILRKLNSLCEMSRDVRIGQLFAHLGFLAQDMFDRSLWDIEDDQLLKVIERHAAELASRHSNVA